jgi:hypothetical protein
MEKGEMPGPGAVTICLYCVTAMKVTDDGFNVRALTTEERVTELEIQMGNVAMHVAKLKEDVETVAQAVVKLVDSLKDMRETAERILLSRTETGKVN